MLYFGFEGKEYTQEEIAKILGIKQSWVSRIMKKSLENIKKQLACNEKGKRLNITRR